MNDFDRDNIWQRKVRDSVLVPGFYGQYSLDGRYVFLDKGRLSGILQKRYAVDTIAQATNGAAVCIEEKLVRWKGRIYSAYALETDSCTKAGHESKGWMHYGRADFLLYGFMQPDRLVAHVIDFPALQSWFWEHVESFPKFQMAGTLNLSAGRTVPIDAVKRNVKVFERTIFPDPSDSLYAELFSDAGRVAA